MRLVESILNNLKESSYSDEVIKEYQKLANRDFKLSKELDPFDEDGYIAEARREFRKHKDDVSYIKEIRYGVNELINDWDSPDLDEDTKSTIDGFKQLLVDIDNFIKNNNI